jgi:hypothetical protein
VFEWWVFGFHKISIGSSGNGKLQGLCVGERREYVNPS